MNEKRAAREAITQNYKNRKDMIRAFKTVVNAQERNSTNREVLSKDEEAMSKIEDNSMKRYIENEITTRNIKTWKMNEKHVRTEMRKEYKEKMKESVNTSRQMIEEEKEFRRFMLNEGSDMGSSKKLSLCTSSKFEVPEEISDRLRTAKKLSQFEQAKEDALTAYEQEMSLRISRYNSSRQQAIKQAEEFGHGIKLNPIRGEDYFSNNGAVDTSSHPVHVCPSSASSYFDSASSLAYPGNGGVSSFDSSCPPVYLDPNYDPSMPNRSACSQLYDPRNQQNAKRTKSKVKNTAVADGLRRYNDDQFGDIVTNGGDMNDDIDDDAVSITDSIDSGSDSKAKEHFPLPLMSDKI